MLKKRSISLIAIRLSWIFKTVATKENTINRKMMLLTSPRITMPSKLAIRKTKRLFMKSYTSLHLISSMEPRASRYSRNFSCGTKYLCMGVPNILGNFTWGTKKFCIEYPRKFSIQDAVFPDLEGGSKFPRVVPFFLGKVVQGCLPYFGWFPECLMSKCLIPKCLTLCAIRVDIF